MISEREMKIIEDAVRSELRLHRVMSDFDCPEGLDQECRREIENLRIKCNIIEYGTPNKPR